MTPPTPQTPKKTLYHSSAATLVSPSICRPWHARTAFSLCGFGYCGCFALEESHNTCDWLLSRTRILSRATHVAVSQCLISFRGCWITCLEKARARGVYSSADGQLWLLSHQAPPPQDSVVCSWNPPVDMVPYAHHLFFFLFFCTNIQRIPGLEYLSHSAWLCHRSEVSMVPGTPLPQFPPPSNEGIEAHVLSISSGANILRYFSKAISILPFEKR